MLDVGEEKRLNVRWEWTKRADCRLVVVHCVPSFAALHAITGWIASEVEKAAAVCVLTARLFCTGGNYLTQRRASQNPTPEQRLEILQRQVGAHALFGLARDRYDLARDRFGLAHDWFDLAVVGPAFCPSGLDGEVAGSLAGFPYCGSLVKRPPVRSQSGKATCVRQRFRAKRASAKDLGQRVNFK